jgi:uncharacterized coiled-coil protein SlyX
MAEKDKIAELEAKVKEMAAVLAAATEALTAQQSRVDPGLEAVKMLAQQSAPAENKNYNEVGPFTYPEGERVRPKPRLSRPTFFGGARQSDEMLTPLEVDLFNKIDSTRVSRGGTWKAEVRQNGSAQELWIDVPVKTLDDRINLPSLVAVLLELNGGEKAADPASLAQRVAELEAKLAAVA